VEVESEREVQEQYTTIETRIATRPKTLWTKTIVQEAYEEKVPKIQTRKVRRPVTKLVEQDAFQDVTIEGTRAVQVPAFRIDEVQGVKLVKIEEWENVELVEKTIGPRVTSERQREVQMFDHEGRKIGAKIFPADAPELDGLAEDDHPEDLGAVVLHESITDYPSQSFHANDEARGPLCLAELDLREEYFVITNRSDEAVPLNGWTVHDAQAHEQGSARRNTFQFSKHAPGLVLGPGQSVKVYSGPDANKRGCDGVTSIQWTLRKIWTDEGDRAYLVDPDGEVSHTLGLDGPTVNESINIRSADGEFEMERSSTKTKFVRTPRKK